MDIVRRKLMLVALGIRDKHAIRSDVSWGAGAFYTQWLIGGGSARKGYLFQASGIWRGRDLTSVSGSKGREIC